MRAPHSGRSHEKAKGLRTALQDIAGKNRHQHHIRHPQQADPGDEQQDRADGGKSKGVAEALLESLENLHPLPGRFNVDGVHDQKGEDHGNIAGRVDQKAHPFAEGANEEAGCGRPQHAGHMDHGRVEGDGVAEIGAVVHHFDNKGLAGGHIESIHRAQKQAQDDDMPDGDGIGEDEGGHNQRLQEGHDLSDDQNPMPVPAVDKDPGQRRQKEGGNLIGEGNRPQQHGGAGQTVDKPAHGRPLHPGTDERNTLAANKQPKIAVLQRPKHEVRPGLLFRIHRILFAFHCGLPTLKNISGARRVIVQKVNVRWLPGSSGMAFSGPYVSPHFPLTSVATPIVRPH